MKALVKGLAGLVGILAAVFFGGRLVLPDALQVDRHVVINAPPEKVFAVVGHLRRFNEWSPWAGIDPKTEYKFEGPDSGAGQKLTWSSSNPAVGSGTQTFTAVAENQKVESEIDFGGMGKATATIDLAPVDKGTGVTWSFRAPIDSTLGRWIMIFSPPPVEADISKGLRQLKTLAEQPAS